ncbi:HAD family hydrolase [Microbacterium aurantiacum]|uniref:HAD family phosphatase n=1 Tax=Microbacterium aurantiacum TaxID=162393 RepID=A0AAJ2HHG3_9MICO|nr:HAD family phosphatase [Microbacterium aurantiacum]MDS0244859.1 HAD family phosphatase [Microbacterium aurantiacum]
MHTEAVIFDFDGTLVQSEHISIELDRRLLAEHGVRLSADDIAARFVGSTKEYHQTELRRLLGAQPDVATVTRYASLFETMFDEVQPTPNVVDTLATLNAPTAIASNNSGHRIRRTLDRLGLRHHFGDHIVAREDVSRGKPAPDPYIRAAEMLGVDPVNCLAVEDSLPGIRAALAAGMTAVGLVNPYTTTEQIVAAGASAITDMADLFTAGCPGEAALRGVLPYAPGERKLRAEDRGHLLPLMSEKMPRGS